MRNDQNCCQVEHALFDCSNVSGNIYKGSLHSRVIKGFPAIISRFATSTSKSNIHQLPLLRDLSSHASISFVVFESRIGVGYICFFHYCFLVSILYCPWHNPSYIKETGIFGEFFHSVFFPCQGFGAKAKRLNNQNITNTVARTGFMWFKWSHLGLREERRKRTHRIVVVEMILKEAEFRKPQIYHKSQQQYKTLETQRDAYMTALMDLKNRMRPDHRASKLPPPHHPLLGQQRLV